jgi:hypothetical protein
MKFVKSECNPPRDARILLHVGPGMERYRFWKNNDAEKHCLADELNFWSLFLPEQPNENAPRVNLMYPETNRSEAEAVHLVFSKMAEIFQNKTAKLSIATHNTAVALLIIQTLVRMGLQEVVQVFWHHETQFSRGWIVDQNTALASVEFDLAPVVDEARLRNLNFGTLNQ